MSISIKGGHRILMRGFTLIELLVVISLIGMLSSVVLASLSKARQKALDSKIKQQLRELRTAANLYYTSAQNYGPQVQGSENRGTSIGKGCASGMFANSLLSQLLLASNYPPSVNAGAYCEAGGGTALAAGGYAVAIPLSDGSFYCVDSTGNFTTFYNFSNAGYASSCIELDLNGGN